MDDKDLLLYAISFLHSNIDNMVEEDLEMSEIEIEARLRKLLKAFSNMTHLPDFMEID
jgi:hypothetical protein